MHDPVLIYTTAASTLLALALLSAAGLRAWRDWLDVQRLRIASRGAPEPGHPPAAARIELADLRERVRKLEAIAAGVDL